MTTKISKSRLGDIRFPKHDKPVNNEVKTYTLPPEELEYYRQKGKIEMGGVKMKPEQAQELENTVTPEMLRDITQNNLEIELRKLEQEVAELSKTNDKLKQELDDLLDRYNKLSLDYETAEQVKYDLTRAEGQLQQLRISKKETDDILTEESKKREALERLVRLYV